MTYQNKQRWECRPAVGDLANSLRGNRDAAEGRRRTRDFAERALLFTPNCDTREAVSEVSAYLCHP